MTKRIFLVLLACGLVFGGIFFFKWKSGQAMQAMFDNMPLPPATITTAKAAPLAWPHQIEAVGTLRAVQQTDVTAETGGVIEAIHFQSGQAVAAGAPLVTLRNTQEEADIARLVASAELAKSSLARKQRLFGQEVIAKAELEAAEAEHKAAVAALAAGKARLGQKQVRAPFAGNLGLRQINLGQFVSPGQRLVSLQTLDPIELDFTLPEQALTKVGAGMALSASVDALAGQQFSGEVIALEPRLNPDTRALLLRGRLANADGVLKPGLFARVKIALRGQRSVLAVPRTAVKFDPYGSAVYVLVPSTKKDAPATVRQRFVKTGATQGDFVEVLDGLKAGEDVATSGLLKLRNDATVIVNNSVQPDATLNPAARDG